MKVKPTPTATQRAIQFTQTLVNQNIPHDDVNGIDAQQ